jgi:hypothetical protein
VKEETDIRQELATIVRDLPAERVKTAVIEWLGREKGDIADLKQNLSTEAYIAILSDTRESIMFFEIRQSNQLLTKYLTKHRFSPK